MKRREDMEQVGFAVLIEQYLAWLARCRARSTRKTWGAVLRAFGRWCAQRQYTIREFDRGTIEEYRDSNLQRGVRPRTVNNILAALTSFGGWLVEQGILAENPAAGVRKVRLDPPNRASLTDSEAAALLQACGGMLNPRRAALARAMLSVLIYAGLRRRECLDLKLADVDLLESRLLVRHGKGDKSRAVYVPAECMKALRAWLGWRDPERCRHDWLWDYDGARRVGDNALRTLLREVGAMAGMRGAPQIRPHAIRRGYATRLLRQGADLEAIRNNLGHEDIRTTAGYLMSDPQHLRQVAELAALRVEQPSAPAKPAAPGPVAARAAWRRRLERR